MDIIFCSKNILGTKMFRDQIDLYCLDKQLQLQTAEIQKESDLENSFLKGSFKCLILDYEMSSREKWCAIVKSINRNFKVGCIVNNDESWLEIQKNRIKSLNIDYYLSTPVTENYIEILVESIIS